MKPYENYIMLIVFPQQQLLSPTNHDRPLACVEKDNSLVYIGIKRIPLKKYFS